MVHRILFVCTANTCRSPLAEHLLRRLATERSLPIEVRSAGIYASTGARMSNYSDHILRAQGIEHAFASQRVQAELLDWADLVLTMTQGHKHDLLQRFPHAVDKLFTLKEYVLIDEYVGAQIAELNRIYAEIEMQFSLGQSVTDAQRQQIRALEKQLPNLDIADPFSGSLDMYQQCAFEIEQHLQKLLDKLCTE